MTSHVFTEDQTTMEWYVDGIPVAELKRRYEAHDLLVEAIKNLLDTWENEGKVPGWVLRFATAKAHARAVLKISEVRNG